MIVVEAPGWQGGAEDQSGSSMEVTRGPEASQQAPAGGNGAAAARRRKEEGGRRYPFAGSEETYQSIHYAAVATSSARASVSPAKAMDANHNHRRRPGVAGGNHADRRVNPGVDPEGDAMAVANRCAVVVEALLREEQQPD
jgi:hypothetical protein